MRWEGERQKLTENKKTKTQKGGKRKRKREKEEKVNSFPVVQRIGFFTKHSRHSSREGKVKGERGAKKEGNRSRDATPVI